MLKEVFTDKKLLMAATTLVGTIVGAGMLGIPYVIAKTGFIYGSLMIIAIGVAFIYLNLFAGEVVLRTKEKHQLSGYAEKYLGPWGKRFMTLALLINIYGALIAYLIGQGAALKAIFGFGEPIYYTIAFFLIATSIVYRGIKTTGKMELILISTLLTVVVIIGIFSINKINLLHLAGIGPSLIGGDGFFISMKELVVSNFALIFLPYGIVLFALLGSPAVPEMREVLVRNPRKLKRAIIIGSSIPIVLYIFFTFIVVGIIGLDNFLTLGANERIATVALGIFTNKIFGLLANFIAVLAMFTSYLTLGMALVETYNYDYEFSRKLSFLFTFGLPLIVVFMGLTSFIAILSATGALAGGLDGILVTLMYWKAKKLGNRKPEYTLHPHKILGWILIIMFTVGIISQFVL